MNKNLQTRKNPSKNWPNKSKEPNNRSSINKKHAEDFAQENENKNEIIELETGRQRRNKAIFPSIEKTSPNNEIPNDQSFFSPSEKFMKQNLPNNSIQKLEHANNITKYLNLLNDPGNLSEANREKFYQIQKTLKNQSTLDLNLFKEYMDLVYSELTNQQMSLIGTERKSQMNVSKGKDLIPFIDGAIANQQK